MKASTRQALLALNRAFYADRAEAFDASRDHPWPGWQRVLEERARAGAAAPRAGRPDRVLDVGCGNGRFGRLLANTARTATEYLGVDASEPLLESARRALRDSPRGFDALLLRLDFLDEPGPDAALPPGPFDLIVVFGVLHHVPSRALRRRLVEALERRLDRGGVLALTAWQFERRERFARSVFPADELRRRAGEWGLDPNDLEAGDHLLGFSGDASTPRYCHHTSASELDALTAGLGLELCASFLDDGKTRDLNLYRVLVKR